MIGFWIAKKESKTISKQTVAKWTKPLITSNSNKLGSIILLTQRIEKICKSTITIHGKISNCSCCYSANSFILISSKQHQQGSKTASFNNTFLICLCILYWDKLLISFIYYQEGYGLKFFWKAARMQRKSGKNEEIIWWNGTKRK